jgi:hypothetical protein
MPVWPNGQHDTEKRSQFDQFGRLVVAPAVRLGNSQKATIKNTYSPTPLQILLLARRLDDHSFGPEIQQPRCGIQVALEAVRHKRLPSLRFGRLQILAAGDGKRRTQMVSIPKHLKALEIEKRAARIRSQWSVAERVRRTGLPPDVPARLQEFILGRREPQWCVVSPHQNENR